MSWEALDLALALHAAPARATELRARPLPDGMRNLLRVALGREEAIAEASAATGQAGAHLVEAALFFVEQQLLARECEHDPWRVLGAAPGTDEAGLRAHHHLLVRLVHPDRNDDWPSAYAERVNRAWRQLRVAEGRELAMSPAAAHVDSGRGITGEAWDARQARPLHCEPAPAPFPVRAPSQRIWMRAAILAGVIVSAAVAWQQWPAPEALVDGAATVPAADLATDPEPTNTIADLPEALVAIDALLPPAPPPFLDKVTADATVEPSPASTATIRNEAAVAATVARPRPAPPRTATTTVAVTPEPAPAAATLVVGASTASETAADAVPPAAPAPAVISDLPLPPSDREALALLDRHALLYAEGDLSGILALYAREVHNDHRLLAPIAAGYARVFDDTARRSIELDALKWQRHEDRITGHARYKLNQQPRGGLWRRAERGRVDFELVRDGDTSRFLRFTSIADHGS